MVVMAEDLGGAFSPRRLRRRRRRGGSRGADGSVEMGGGGGICLRGYPPWQARLTEIFSVKDGRGVDYQVFLRALHRYAKAEFRLGG